jgi:hypothetical protein
MSKKHKRLSKDHRRELKKKGYYTIKNMISNNLSKDRRLKAITITTKNGARLYKRFRDSLPKNHMMA